MAYVYCPKCEAGQDNPDFESCIRQRIVCHMCSEEIPLRHDERDEALIELEQRISALEAKAEPSEELLIAFFAKLASSISSSDGHTGIPCHNRPKLAKALLQALKGA